MSRQSEYFLFRAKQIFPVLSWSKSSLDKDGKLDMEMVVKNNRGYIPADQNFDGDLSVDYIPLDSSHSPVKKVNYRVEAARVGKRIDP